jgi:murein DD-endopeptidase MepM/ murein hydrolase activator NlpD
VAVLAVLALALTLCALPPPAAPAGELDEQQRRVQREIRQAEKHLRHSSRALVRASRRVDRTRGRLEEARRVLEERQAQAAAAAAVDARMQAALDAATARLERAQKALAQGQRSHEEQQDVLRHIAAQTYQSGSPGLVGLTLFLTSQDPASLSTQLNVVRTVMARERATLQRLEASRLLLGLQRTRVAEARAEVARRREAAAQTLAHRQRLEAQAADAEERVAERLAEHADARARARRTKEADQRRLAQLRKERAKVVRLIKKREARLRKKRSRAAIARAKKASHARNGPLSLPVESYVTSSYGMRLHPIYHAWRLHDGTDFGARCGRPVRAAARGRVIGRYYNVGYGNRVIIAHGYRRGASITTTYNHLSRYSARVGQRVRRGEVIGFVGTTGYSTGCHLHFMVFRNGRTVDPMRWL